MLTPSHTLKSRLLIEVSDELQRRYIPAYGVSVVCGLRIRKS